MDTIIYTMRHGEVQEKWCIDLDKPLSDTGAIQIARATKKYLSKENIKSIYTGDRWRHTESAKIVKTIKAFSNCYNFSYPMLTIENAQGIKDLPRCIEEGHRHPKGLDIGFSVKYWEELNPVMMQNLRKNFVTFFQNMYILEGSVLIISSSPLIECLITDKNIRLLGHAGIIKYVINKDRLVISSEVIFQGFY